MMFVKPAIPYVRFCTWPLILLALILLCSCDQDLVLKPDFSINVFSPGPKWPNEKKLTPTQREVFHKYGRPDCFRLLWSSDGALKKRDALAKEMKDKKPNALPPSTWIYMSRGIEIVFAGSAYREVPINDQIKLVVKYGDPEDEKEENGITQWIYYSTGKIYKFSNAGHIIEEKDFPAMGRFIK